jgi:2-dehydropantoate 2-reductase
MRNIFIIGSGTIGRVLAVFLKLAGRNVVLVRGSVNDGSRRMEHIRVELSNGSIQEADVEIATLSAFDSLDGIIVLANKSYGNEQLSIALSHKTGHSPIVFLQNGLGIEQPFIDKGFPEIYRCVLFVTSQFVDMATVRFKPVAVCPIGVISGDDIGLSQVVDLLTVPDFQFRKEQDIQTVTWKKAIINSVFNSVCPLLDTDNGIFHRDETALRIARRVLSECIGIAGAKGVLLDPAEVEENLLNISRSSDGQLISTLQDIRNKRRTEIETLNFEIVRIARSLDKEDTVKETRLLGELTKLKADLNNQP